MADSAFAATTEPIKATEMHDPVNDAELHFFCRS